MNRLQASALKLAEAGLHVFPVVPGEKTPLTTHGFHSATRDLRQIDRWWRTAKPPNIGVATGASGLLVVDLDGPEAECGWESLLRQHGEIRTLEVKTPRPGRHLWFKQPPAGQLPNTAGRLGPHIDTRGIGGYVIAPPSWRRDGRYAWADPAYPLAATPSWLVEALTVRAIVPSIRPQPAGRPDGIISGLVQAVLDAPVGQRNSLLNWAAYRGAEHAAAGRIELQEIVTALLLAGTTAGLSERETERTVNSAVTGAYRRRAVA